MSVDRAYIRRAPLHNRSPDGWRTTVDMDWAARFETFVDKKTTAASTSQIPGYTTVESRTDGQRLSAIGNSWTIECFDGRFYESWPDDQGLPAVNVVFVQSADGNTGTRNPMELGGGLTDKHLVYEGLSSVHADAILTGATTIAGDDTVMALWHPKLVSLRIALGLPRFPIQVVATRTGRLDIESSLLYNVPMLRVFIITGDAGAEVLRPLLVERPWIEIISGGADSDLVGGLRTLRANHGVTRVSSTGGRTLATQLIDAGVVQDLYLTTSPKTGGEPHTPFYTGTAPLTTTRIVKKAGKGDETGVTFEHLVIPDATRPL
jgi:riboflavin biosynthesis pyrimidine reductase